MGNVFHNTANSLPENAGPVALQKKCIVLATTYIIQIHLIKLSFYSYYFARKLSIYSKDLHGHASPDMLVQFTILFILFSFPLYQPLMSFN